MVNPGIQNDFSYYRRSLAKMKMTNRAGDIKIKDELANRMSLFFAYPTPMMRVLTDSTVEFLNNVRLASVSLISSTLFDYLFMMLKSM